MAKKKKVATPAKKQVVESESEGATRDIDTTFEGGENKKREKEKEGNEKKDGALDGELAGKESSSDAALARPQEVVPDIADGDYLINACRVLSKCRRVLKFTYIHAYYMAIEGVEQDRHLFEFMQGELEKNTELLSELLEHRPGERLQIIQQQDAATVRLNHLLEASNEGVSNIKFT